MVFEAGERLSEALEDGLADELADGPVPLRLGRDVEDTHARHASAARILVPVAEDLQGCADRQERAPGIEGAGEARGAAELVGSERLSGIFATAKRVNVEAVGDFIGQPHVDDLGVDAAPAGAFGENQRIAAVTVGTQHLGHEDADSQRGGAHRVPSFRSSRTLKSRMAV